MSTSVGGQQHLEKWKSVVIAFRRNVFRSGVLPHLKLFQENPQVTKYLEKAG